MLGSGNGAYNTNASTTGGGAFTSGDNRVYTDVSTGAFTWDAMFTTSSLSDIQVLFSFDDLTTGRGPNIFINGDLNAPGIGTGLDIPTTGDHAWVANEWFHMAYVYSGTPDVTGNVSVYWTRVDSGATAANLLGTGTLTTPLPTDGAAPFYVGSNGRSPFRNEIKGNMDEVRLSNVARGAGDFIFVPEPSSSALVALGLGAFFLRRRR